MRYFQWTVVFWIALGLSAQPLWADNDKPYKEYKEKHKEKHKEKKDKHHDYKKHSDKHHGHEAHSDDYRPRADKHEGPPAWGTKVPPGLAKKGGIPPGLAKKFGSRVPSRAYIAFDPNRYDQAWFLIGDRWVLKPLYGSQRNEIRQYLDFPSVPPPVPLPSVNFNFRVVLFD